MKERKLLRIKILPFIDITSPAKKSITNTIGLDRLKDPKINRVIVGDFEHLD